MKISAGFDWHVMVFGLSWAAFPQSGMYYVNFMLGPYRITLQRGTLTGIRVGTDEAEKESE